VRDHLVLVGMMGAGKSTVARMVAARLGWPHTDIDDMVERAAALSVAEIFATQGEASFRAAESAALVSALSAGEPSVVSVGGGAVLDPANRALMRRTGTVVWLRARPATLARRVGRAVDRPLLAADPDGPAAALTRLEVERRPLYEEVATAVVDVDDTAAEDVADAVLGALGTSTEGRP
jgi:shikimate kinase